jgi:hypothetical protein
MLAVEHPEHWDAQRPSDEASLRITKFALVNVACAAY